MKTFYYLLSILFLLSGHTLSAQNDTLVGILKNAKDKPMKKYEITLGKINPKTVKTDKFGVFEIPGANLNDTLYFFDKSTKKEVKVPVRGYDYVNIALKGNTFSAEQINAFDPYLVKARERERDRMVSGSTMNRGEIEKTRCNNLLCVLRRMSGVMVSGNDIRIRGITSINSGTSPLVVVDGVPSFDTSVLLSTPIKDVKEISVLKDATQYGAQGANGAIVLKTGR